MAGSDESLADRVVSARVVVITLPSFVRCAGGKPYFMDNYNAGA